MSKKVYLITRSVVALAAFAVFFWLFLVPPSIKSGVTGNKYSSCHAVAWNFTGDLRPVLNDSFDVESPTKVEKYVNGAVGHPSEDANKALIRKGIHEACKEARQGRSLVIIVASIFFAVVFLSVPKPKPSRGKRPSGEGGSLEDNGSSSGKEPVGERAPSGDSKSSSGSGSSNGNSSTSDKSKSEPSRGKPRISED